MLIFSLLRRTSVLRNREKKLHYYRFPDSEFKKFLQKFPYKVGLLAYGLSLDHEHENIPSHFADPRHAYPSFGDGAAQHYFDLL